jgi:hypothetical protein
MTVVLVLMMSGCATAYIDSSQGRDGSSIRNSVIVGSVRAEYLYIDRTYPEFRIFDPELRDSGIGESRVPLYRPHIPGSQHP